MKIKVRFENTVTSIEIPEEDFTLMIDVDYQTRLATAEDKTVVNRRTPQEIMDERFNKPDYNNWHKFDRHRGYASKESENKGDFMDCFADYSDTEQINDKFDYEDICEKIRLVMKPAYAEMIIAINIKGLTVGEYASLIGDKPNSVSHRLKRAEKKLKNIF